MFDQAPWNVAEDNDLTALLEQRRVETYVLVCDLLKSKADLQMDLREFSSGSARRWFIHKLQGLLHENPDDGDLRLADRLFHMLTGDVDDGAIFYAGLVKTSLNSPVLERWLPSLISWGQSLAGHDREMRDLLLGLGLRRLIAGPVQENYALLKLIADAFPLNEDTFMIDALMKVAHQQVTVRHQLGLELQEALERAIGLEESLSEARIAYQNLEMESKALSGEAEDALRVSLFQALAPALTQLPTIRAQKLAGKRLKVGDVLAMFQHVERAAQEMGFEAIGAPGEEVRFEPKLHNLIEQGGEVFPGAPVEVRFVGYRLGERVLRRAMVSKLPLPGRK